MSKQTAHKFIHVSRAEGEEKLHISHLHHYVSAYESSKEMVGQLRDDLNDALKLAARLRQPQIVDQDGEMFFICYPNGDLSLCLRWKTYTALTDDDGM